MKNPMISRLAKNLVNYSIELKPGEKVLIELFDAGEELAAEVIREVYNKGAKPFLSVKNNRLMRELFFGTDREHMSETAGYEVTRMNDMDAYLGIRGFYNSSEWVDVPTEKIAAYQTNWFKAVHTDTRLKKRWCVMRYPTPAMAQKAGMSADQFEEFYFDVCTLDYEKMSRAMNPLVALMSKTDKVEIRGLGTDLTFSIKGLPAIKCEGKRNVPDGEVFTAPVKGSINGRIAFNVPKEYNGKTYENVRLEFKGGRVVKATSSDTGGLNKILDTDEGARYAGEFALGINPYITKPMKEMLFDEKIGGSFHLTPGNAYDTCDNGNKSAVHFDLVCIQTPEYGGGEIYFDGVLVRKDGRFVLKELHGLNPENLMG